LSQEEAKKSIAMDEDIQEFADQNTEYNQSQNIEESTQTKSFINTKKNILLPLIGFIVSASDISNPTTFLVGAIIGLSAIFF
jgi:hypothetical protein